MPITKEQFSLLSSKQESEEDSAKAIKLTSFGSGIVEMVYLLANGEKLKESWKKRFEEVENLLNEALKGKEVAGKLMKEGFKLTDVDDIRVLSMFQELNHFSINNDEKYSQRWAERLKKEGGWDDAHASLLVNLRETNSKILRGEKIKEIEPEKLADFKSIFKSMLDSNMIKLAKGKSVDKFIEQ